MNEEIERLAALLTQIRDAVARAPPDASAALALVSGDFQVTKGATAVAASPVNMFGQDPTRWAVCFSNSSTMAGLSVWPGSDASSIRGFVLSTSAPVLFLNFRDYGSLVQLDWWTGTIGSGTVSWVTVQYRPTRGV